MVSPAIAASMPVKAEEHGRAGLAKPRQRNTRSMRVNRGLGSVRPGRGVTTKVSSRTSTPSASFHVCMMGVRGDTVCWRTQRVPLTISGPIQTPKLRGPPRP